EGNPIADGWRDETVKTALDLCLACKACKSECPVNVDMAAYKAEFLSHYYDGPVGPHRVVRAVGGQLPHASTRAPPRRQSGAARRARAPHPALCEPDVSPLVPSSRRCSP